MKIITSTWLLACFIFWGCLSDSDTDEQQESSSSSSVVVDESSSSMEPSSSSSEDSNKGCDTQAEIWAKACYDYDWCDEELSDGASFTIVSNGNGTSSFECACSDGRKKGAALFEEVNPCEDDSQDISSTSEDCYTKERVWDEACYGIDNCLEKLGDGGDVEIVEINTVKSVFECTCSDGTSFEETFVWVLDLCPDEF